jgi:phosphoribosyl 1,2-cyclic phosphodiesterase
MQALILASGSTGNCTALRSEPGSPILLLDAGLSKHETFKRLNTAGWAPQELGGVVVSHEHLDHCYGLKGISQFMRTMPILMSHGTAEKLTWINESHPVHYIQHGEATEIAGFEINCVSIAHDAREPLAFDVFDAKDGANFTYVMDLGTIDDDVRELIADSETVFIESNYDAAMLNACEKNFRLKQRIVGGQGHLSNTQIAESVIPCLTKATRRLILGHISETSNDREIVELSASLALAHCGSDAELHLAARHSFFNSERGTT